MLLVEYVILSILEFLAIGILCAICYREGLKKGKATKPSVRHFYCPPRIIQEPYFRDLDFETRIEAEHTLDSLNYLIDNYGQTTVSDLQDLIGYTTSFKNTHYGWTNLNEALIYKSTNGYILRLPLPKNLKD